MVTFMVLNYYQRIMPLVLKELASSEATNRRNAAFCVGEICKNGGAPTLKYPSQSYCVEVMGISFLLVFFTF